MARKAEAETAEPALGIRSTLAALEITAAHNTAAWSLGHSASQLLDQVNSHLLDAQSGLRQLASTATGADAERIRELIGRLS